MTLGIILLIASILLFIATFYVLWFFRHFIDLKKEFTKFDKAFDKFKRSDVAKVSNIKMLSDLKLFIPFILISIVLIYISIGIWRIWILFWAFCFMWWRAIMIQAAKNRLNSFLFLDKIKKNTNAYIKELKEKDHNTPGSINEFFNRCCFITSDEVDSKINVTTVSIIFFIAWWLMTISLSMLTN